MVWVQLAFFFALVFLAFGSALSLSNASHWFVRGWDFTRLQIVFVAIGCGAGVWAINRFWPLHDAAWIIPASLTIAVFLVIYHLYWILPYTPLAKQQAARANEPITADCLVRLVESNVQMENEQFDLWQRVVSEADPDILIVLEINQKWWNSCREYFESFEHRVTVVQENYYGMLLLSKLPIEQHRICHLVERDIPSIDAVIRLRSGHQVRVVAIHPRPPEPVRDTDSTARDAELVLWGREIEDSELPVIVGGDLNDVAWSNTTKLFLRISELLDPRRGRGFYNTFHARHRMMRFPLDHVFYSNEFHLHKLRRLPYAGSDHFPMMIEVVYQPRAADENEVLRADHEDYAEAEELVERAQEQPGLNPASAPA